MKLQVPDYILSLKPYSPGKPLEELEREYGIKDSVKLASNENPLGPSPMAVSAIKEAIGKLNRYPDGGGHELTGKISEKLNVKPCNIVLGNGSDEIIGMLTRALLRPGDEVVIPVPSFLMYDIMVRSAGAVCVYAPLKSLTMDLEGIIDRITSKTRMVFICNPNNPTGTVVLKDDFEDFLKSVPDHVVVVVDEAYIEFVRDKRCAYSIDYLGGKKALVTLRTFSKAYGLAGLRIGYGVMDEEISALLHRIRQPFNANSLAQIGALAALDDREFLEKTKTLVYEGINYMCGALDRLGIEYYPTQTNFFLIDVKKDANEVFESLLKLGVIVRSMASYGYPNFIRVNVGLYEENLRFIKALKEVLQNHKTQTCGPKNRLVITIDGPAGAGKTTVSRILAKRLGYDYIDTGALYRGVAYNAISAGIRHDDDAGLESLCKTIKLEFVNDDKKGLRLLSNNRDITEHIRTPEITMFASAVSARPVVRKFLLGLQRDIGKNKGVVFEGRDMGTVVFPDAEVKFYLDAALEIRARRRHKELMPKTNLTLKEVENNMRRRDNDDSSRTHAPLRPANDAIMIDSSKLTVDEVVSQMMTHI